MFHFPVVEIGIVLLGLTNPQGLVEELPLATALIPTIATT